MRVLGLVPARGGSKAIPRKNLVLLGGKPLIQWTLDVASASCLERVVVSTDDREIAGFCESRNIEVPFIRPERLATDTAQTIDVVLHALQTLESEFDAVMTLQPTSPFRTTHHIDECISLLADSDADSVISVVNVGGHHPARMKYLENGVLIDPPFAERVENQPRQLLQPMYIRNGAIYLSRVSALRQRTFKGLKSLGYVMDLRDSVNIDDPLDLVVAEAMLS